MPARRGLEGRAEADPSRLIAALLDHEVEFVVIGGVAAVAHGVQRITRDLDLLIEPSKRNRRRAIEALVSLEAEEFRAASEALGRADAGARTRPGSSASPASSKPPPGDSTSATRSPEAPGWEDARPRAIEVEAFGRAFLVLDKDTLIRSKLAAGREKDRQDVAELADLPDRGDANRHNPLGQLPSLSRRRLG